MALATSGVRRYADAVLAETGLAGSFAVEVTGEDVVRGKPAPDVFALTAMSPGCGAGRLCRLRRCPQRDRRRRCRRHAGGRGAEHLHARVGISGSA